MDFNSIFSGKEIGKINKLNLRAIYYEHVKRRPLIIEEMKPLWNNAHEKWLSQANLDELDYRRRPKYLIPTISTDEKKIINTPMDELMETYEKTLI